MACAAAISHSATVSAAWYSNLALGLASVLALVLVLALAAAAVLVLAFLAAAASFFVAAGTFRGRALLGRSEQLYCLLDVCNTGTVRLLLLLLLVVGWRLPPRSGIITACNCRQHVHGQHIHEVVMMQQSGMVLPKLLSFTPCSIATTTANNSTQRAA